MRLHARAALPALVLLLGCGAQGSSQSMGMPANGGGSGASSAVNAGSAGSAGGASGAVNAGSTAAAGATASAGAAGMPAAVPAAGNGGSAAAGSSGSSPPTGGNGARPDAGSLPSQPANGCPDGAFCDSFDDSASALDAARWSTVMPSCSGSGQVALDDAVFHSGRRSLRVQGGAGYCNHVFASPVGFHPPDPFYARMFVRFAAPLGASHVTFFALHDGNEGKDLRMGGQSEILMWNRESDDATLPELSPAGIALSEKPEAAAWTCIELMIDAHARTLRTWVDGEAVPGLTVEGEPTKDVDGQWQNKPDWQPKLEDVKLGWESYGDATNTLWFDDVAFGSSRFGCER